MTAGAEAEYPFPIRRVVSQSNIGLWSFHSPHPFQQHLISSRLLQIPTSVSRRQSKQYILSNSSK